MRITKRNLALLALPARALADNVHLVDFPPRVSSLSTACQSVYTQTIGGCSSTDFTGDTCSAGCVKALQAMEPVVIQACSNQGISGQNVIVAFLNNSGPQSLCSNAAEILGGGGLSPSASASVSVPAVSSSSTSAAASNTATLISPTSTNMASTSTNVAASAGESSSTSTSLVVQTTTSSISEVFSGTVTASSLVSSMATSSVPGAATSSGLLVASSTSRSETASSTHSSDPSSETDNAHTGGGSPFDGSGNTSDAARLLTSVSAASVLTICFFLATMR